MKTGSLFFALATFLFLSNALGQAQPVSKSCDKSITLPKCTEVQKKRAIPFGKGISTRTPPKSDAQVIFLGTVTQAVTCSEKLCDSHDCGTCWGHVRLTAGSGPFSPSADHHESVRLTSDDKRYEIKSGPSALTCRPLAGPEAQVLIVEGTFRLENGKYSIHNPVMCRP